MENWIWPPVQGEEFVEVGGGVILDGSWTSQDLVLQAQATGGADRRPLCSWRNQVTQAWTKTLPSAGERKNHHKEQIAGAWHCSKAGVKKEVQVKNDNILKPEGVKKTMENISKMQL